MEVIIGIDPHKATHVACAIDRTEVEVAHLRVRAGKRQVDQLLAWAPPGQRTWAVESAGGLGYLLSQQLVAAGEHVVDVPATLASRVRVLANGRSNKNDPNDARSVAIAALRAPNLTVVTADDHTAVLRMLAKAHLDLGRAKNREACRLHALVCEMIAGGIRKEVVVSQAEALLASITPTSTVERQRLELAHEVLDDIARIDGQLALSRKRIATAVSASSTRLVDLYGVGPIWASVLIGYTGDVRRFATSDNYAAYNGTAPIEFSSGGRVAHRLSRRGNRTLNHAVHMVAVTQIRHKNSEGRVYFDAKVAAGKTKREALRALKRRVSDRIFNQLMADARRK